MFLESDIVFMLYTYNARQMLVAFFYLNSLILNTQILNSNQGIGISELFIRKCLIQLDISIH